MIKMSPRSWRRKRNTDRVSAARTVGLQQTTEQGPDIPGAGTELLDPQSLKEHLLHTTPPTPPCPAMSSALNSFFLYASSPSPWFSCFRFPSGFSSATVSFPSCPRLHPATHRLNFLSSDFSLRLKSLPERTLPPPLPPQPPCPI